MTEVAGAAIGSIAFVDQLIRRVDQLRDFYSTVRDAPKAVVRHGEDLARLRRILGDVREVFPIIRGPFTDAIARCERSIEPLERLVDALHPGFQSKLKVVRYWSGYRLAQQEEKIKSLWAELSQTKLDLIIVQLTSLQNQNHIPTVDSAISELQSPAELTGESPPPGALQATAQLKSDMSATSKSLSTWHEALHSEPASTGFNNVIKASLESVLTSSEIKTILQDVIRDSSSHALSRQHEKEAASNRLDGSRQAPQGTYAVPNRAVRVCEREFSKQYKTLLGTFHYRSRVLRTGAHLGDYVESPAKELETTWTVIPAFFGPAFSFVQSKAMGAWQHNLKLVSVVPADAPILTCCVRGDVEGVKRLLSQRRAGPNDCDDKGFTALHRAAAMRHVELCRLLIQNGADVKAASFVSGETALHHLPVNRSRVKSADLLATVKLLVAFGTDPDLEDSRRQTALQAFEAFFDWPGRVALRSEMARCLSWLRTSCCSSAEDGRDDGCGGAEQIGRLYNNVNMDEEVESLDSILGPDDADARTALSRCPGSVAKGWTALHVLMHLRVEPVWHCWSAGDIRQQKDLWSEAMRRALEQGADAHAVDIHGDTPTSLALRSLFTFYVWQKAVAAAAAGPGLEPGEFARREMAASDALRRDGWDEETLAFLLAVPAERLYLGSAEWRERAEFVQFSDGSADDGVHVRCCWFQLLDALRHRSALPAGWLVLAEPRRFFAARVCRYWRREGGVLTDERPEGGRAVDVGELGGGEEEEVLGGLARLGVVWKGG